MTLPKFLLNLAIAVDNGGSSNLIADSDHPECPECGNEMDFFGGNRDYGEGYWKCPNCRLKVTEDDLEPYKEKIWDNPGKYF